MFVGHEAIGLAGRAKVPRISLGTWLMAVQFLDLLWPIFLLLGWLVPLWAWWVDRHRVRV